MASNTVSNDQARFIYLGIAIIDKLTGILRDLLSTEILPANIKQSIKNCKTPPRLSSEQTTQIDNATRDGYLHFDITLLYTVIRNVCQNIKNPTQGWGNVKTLPPAGEITVGDDVERIRIIRNKMYGHVSSTSVTEHDFNNYWQDISDICRRLGNFLGRNYEKELQNIKGCALDPALMTRYADAISSGYQKDMVLVDVVYEIRDKMSVMMENRFNTENISVQLTGEKEVRHGEKAVLTAYIPHKLDRNEIYWSMFDGEVAHSINTKDPKYRGSQYDNDMFTLIINDVNNKDKGYYQINVKEREGSPTSRKVHLNVIGDSPTISLSNPIRNEDTVTIPCKVFSEEPILDLRWTKGGDNIDRHFRFIGGDITNPSLTISQANNLDEGSLHCSATNCYGTTTKTMTLENPKIYLSDPIHKNRSMLFKCTIACFPPVTHVVWKRNGQEINLQETGKYMGGTIKDPGLIIDNVDHNDNGEYKCYASNALGTTESASAEIGIPEIKLTGSSKVIYGEKAIFTATIHPEPSDFHLEWRKSTTSSPIPIVVDTDKYFGLSTNPSSCELQILQSDILDQASYKLVASKSFNDGIQLESEAIDLDVTGDKPTISVASIKQQENNVKITCIVEIADSPPLSAIKWKKDGVDLDPSKDPEKYHISSNDDTSLTIMNAGFSDQGQYQCSATNLLGTSCAGIVIDVSSCVYYRHGGEMYFGYEDTMYSWVDLEILPIEQDFTCSATFTNLKCNPVISKVIEKNMHDKALTDLKRLSNVDQMICFGLLFEEKYRISDGSWFPLLERISLHLGIKSKSKREYQDSMFSATHGYLSRDNGNLKLLSEEAERETLWAFLNHGGKFQSNFRFLFQNTAIISSVSRHVRTRGYRRKNKELYICIPNFCNEYFVKKLGTNILDHPIIEDSDTFHIISTELKIPKEVLWWGKDGQERYLRYLKNDRIKVYSSRGMILGCAGAGKTTLLHRLRQDCMENIQKIKSTRGLEVHNDVFIFNDKDDEETSIIPNDEQVSSHLKVTVDDITRYMDGEEKTDTDYEYIGDGLVGDGASTSSGLQLTPISNNQVTSTNELSIPETWNVTTRMLSKVEASAEIVTDAIKINAQYDNSTIPTNEMSLGNEPIETSETFCRVEAEHKIQQKQEGNINNDEQAELFFTKTSAPYHVHSTKSIDVERVVVQCYQRICSQSTDIPKTVSILDLAGHADYYASHQIYLNSRDFYILVLDMSLGLDGDVQIGTDEETLFHCNKQYSLFFKRKQREFYIFWLKSIRIHCGKSARVLVVVTHAEEKSNKEKEKFHQDLWDVAKSWEIDLSVHLEKIFFIGFQERKDEHLEDLDHIRKHIANKIKNLESWGQFIPASWILFEEILQKIKIEEKVVRFKDILALSKKMNVEEIDDVQVTDILKFFNDIGVILFFNEEPLRDIIITDIQWFVDSFKNIITDPVHAKEDLHSECISEWMEFNSTGILAENLLDFIWKHSKNDSESFVMHKKEIIDFMIRLGMMTVMHTKEGKTSWYIPCVNKKPFIKAIDQTENSSSILCFLFEILPEILFFQFVAKCSEIWRFAHERKETCIYHTAVIFFDGHNYIQIAMSRRLIGIQVIFVSEENHRGRKMKQKMQKILSTLIQTFHYNLKYEVGYICDKRFGYFEDSCEHVILESDLETKFSFGSSFACPKCDFTERHLVKWDGFMFWKEVCQQLNMRPPRVNCK